MSEINYSYEQLRAMNDRGGELLVSAAAGSGKTQVLVSRIINDIIKNGSSVDDYLVITFTNAAAAEMRGRITEEISKHIAESPDDRRMRRQLDIAGRADISTIHGFCAARLREYAHTLGLSPDFRIMDDREGSVMAADVLEEVLNERYSDPEKYPAFPLLSDSVSDGSSDRQLVKLIIESYNKLMSHAYPEKWAREMQAEFDSSRYRDVSQTVCGKFLFDKAVSTLGWCLEETEKLLDRASEEADFYVKYAPSLEETERSIEAALKASEDGWDALYNALPIEFPRAKAIKGYDDLKNARKKIQNMTEKAKAYMPYSSDECFEDMAAVKPVTDELFETIIAFKNAFAEEKRKQNVLDYSDLEHFTLELLYDADGRPSKAAEEISSRYREILVDEYQDVNAIQELIFGAVSKNRTNVFMVGDVKQSIYRFRLADPTIFLEKYRTFADAGDEPSDRPTKILLSKNYRSKKGILDAANYVFANLMSTQFGEMDYTEKEYLYAGATYPGEPGGEVEFYAIDTANVPKTDDAPKKSELEAVFAARRIKELMADYCVSEGETTRPLKYRDIVILMRAPGAKAQLWSQVFRREGVPAAFSKSESLFETTEFSVLLSLLTVIVNPRDDVPLVSVLRSPLFGFTADELANIRASSKTGDFYTALKIYAENNARAGEFLTKLNHYRDVSPDMSVSELIWTLYSDTAMISVFGAMHDGDTRINNLMLMVKLAEQYEKSGYKGLYAFTDYLRRMISDGVTPVTDEEEESGNCVRIMSIHKSKGLEFPVVFLSDLDKADNREDTNSSVLFHQTLGVGMMRRELDRKIKYHTLPRTAIAKKLTDESKAEELRCLYVAMTRAREKLIMTCTCDDWAKTASDAKFIELPASPMALNELNSDGKRLISVVLPLFEEGRDIVLNGEKPDRNAWITGVVEAAVLTEPMKVKNTVKSEEQVNGEQIAEVRRRVQYVYPYERSQTIPSKLTATELKGRFVDEEASEDAEPVVRGRRGEYARPDFDGKRGLTAAQRGTVMHKAIQLIDLKNVYSKESIDAEIERLLNSGAFSEKEAENTDTDALWYFFSGPLGKRMLASENVRREFKFSLLCNASEYYDASDGDEILMQGVVDCFFEENGELVLIDFKTDRVNDGNADERSALYRGQIEAYRSALERICGKKVKEACLCYLSSKKIVSFH